MKETGEVVGLLAQRGRFLVAEPFFERGRRLTVERDRKARPGQLALLRPPARGRSAKVVRLLGRPDVARDVIEALMLDRGLARRFPAGVERAAEEARQAIDDGDAARESSRPARPADVHDRPGDGQGLRRRDLLRAAGRGRWRVWVHIADVTAYVRPGSPIDREAYRRATSVYVPGAVEPMLPAALSNDACSLVPGVDRLAVTVELELNGPNVVRTAFYRSRIRSDVRLDYDQVDRIFAGLDRAEEPWAAPLAAARAAAAALEARRAQGSALVLEGAEPEFHFDLHGHVIESTAKLQTESHRLIEHLMIAANEQVARLLSERGIPALYRVHERPEAAAVQRLVAQLATLEVPTPPLPEQLSPQQAADAVGEISRAVDQHVRRTGHGRQALTSLVLRTLKQAHYAPRGLGHSGLGLEHYCHFTSPIRRYPDVICHRALLSAVGGGEDQPPAGAMEQAGTWTSARERDALGIERTADDVVRCFLLERRLLDTGWDTAFEGEVVGVIGAGAFVAFGEGYEGLLPVRRMRGDWWELNEEATMLRGTESGRAIRLGDPIMVRVERVDAPRGRVDLVSVH